MLKQIDIYIYVRSRSLATQALAKLSGALQCGLLTHFRRPRSPLALDLVPVVAHI